MVVAAVVVILASFLIIVGNPVGQKLIGGDKDKGGCLIAAGYSWCEEKNKCVRVWEEPCTEEDVVRNYLKEHISELSPEPEVLGGEFFVTDLKYVDTNKYEVTYEDGHNMYVADFVFKIEGEEVIPISFDLVEQS